MHYFSKKEETWSADGEQMLSESIRKDNSVSHSRHIFWYLQYLFIYSSYSQEVKIIDDLYYFYFHSFLQ